MKRLLITTQSPSRVTVWLNKENVAPGPYVKRTSWNVPLLRHLLCDPVIHGTSTYRRITYRLLFKKGDFHRDVNPNPEMKYYPELAFMTQTEQEAMLATVGWTINWNELPRSERPHLRCRSRAVWPQLAAKCSVCGSTMVVMGHMLKCSKSLNRTDVPCWLRSKLFVHGWCNGSLII